MGNVRGDSTAGLRRKVKEHTTQIAALESSGGTTIDPSGFVYINPTTVQGLAEDTDAIGSQVGDINDRLTEIESASPNLIRTSISAYNANTYHENGLAVVGLDIFREANIYLYDHEGYLVGVYYYDLSAAVADAGDHNTIVVNGYVDFTAPIPVKNITIVGYGRLDFQITGHLLTSDSSNKSIRIVGFSEVRCFNGADGMFGTTHNNLSISFENCANIIAGGASSFGSGTGCSVSFTNCNVTLNSGGVYDRNLVECSSGSCNLISNNSKIVGFASLGLRCNATITGGELRLYYLLNHNNDSTNYFKSVHINCASNKLAAGSAYSSVTTKVVNASFNCCSIYSEGDTDESPFGLTHGDFFFCPSFASKFIFVSTVFKLVPTSGVSPYYLAKVYSGGTIGKIGFSGTVSSHDKDASVTPIFGSLVVNTDIF